jgi:hypothetical protein
MNRRLHQQLLFGPANAPTGLAPGTEREFAGYPAGDHRDNPYPYLDGQAAPAVASVVRGNEKSGL